MNFEITVKYPSTVRKLQVSPGRKSANGSDIHRISSSWKSKSRLSAKLLLPSINLGLVRFSRFVEIEQGSSNASRNGKEPSVTSIPEKLSRDRRRTIEGVSFPGEEKERRSTRNLIYLDARVIRLSGRDHEKAAGRMEEVWFRREDLYVS